MPEVGVDNPFLFGSPVECAEQFWGRTRLAQSILEYVRGSQCVSLVGPDGLGKTSLLNYVSDPSVQSSRGLRPETTFFCRIEGGELVDRDQASSLGYLMDRVIDQADEMDSTLGSYLRDAIEGRGRGHLGLRTLFRVLCETNRQPVITVDDFDDVAHNARLEDSFFAALRSLATGCQVSYVVASVQPLYELEKMRPEASTLCGICRQITLEPFSEQESREMLLGLLERAQVAFPEWVVEQILSWGGNEPWRLQLAGYEAFQVWQENGGELHRMDRAALERRFDRAVAA
jgi:hypothetical protein